METILSNNPGYFFYFYQVPCNQSLFASFCALRGARGLAQDHKAGTPGPNGRVEQPVLLLSEP